MIADLVDVARWWSLRVACRALGHHSTSCRANPHCPFRRGVR